MWECKKGKYEKHGYPLLMPKSKPCGQKWRRRRWHLKIVFGAAEKKSLCKVFNLGHTWGGQPLIDWLPLSCDSLCTVILRYWLTFCFPVIFPNLFVWHASQTLVTASVLLHMRKVQRSACACVWVVGPSTIKTASCLADNSTLCSSTHTSLDWDFFLLTLRCLMPWWTPCRVSGWAAPTTCRPTTKMPRACFSGSPGRLIWGTPSSSSSPFGFTCGLQWASSWSGWLWSETGLI